MFLVVAACNPCNCDFTAWNKRNQPGDSCLYSSNQRSRWQHMSKHPHCWLWRQDWVKRCWQWSDMVSTTHSSVLFNCIYLILILHWRLKCDCRFDNLRIPRENLLNSVADVSSDGQYVSAIENPDQVAAKTMVGINITNTVLWSCSGNVFKFLFQRFGAFLAPLTSGRVTIASCAIYSAKVHVSAVFVLCENQLYYTY